MRFSKTQKELLYCVRNRGTWTISCGHGTGPKGGRVSYGQRGKKALLGLLQSRSVRLVENFWVLRNGSNGGEIFETVYVFAST